MSLNPGTSLANYQILSALGAGGMGEVFRARDPRLNRDVGVKVLPKDFVVDADLRDAAKPQACVTEDLT